jgi:uncharacterized protein YbaR (Trm112 family)/SAM-dependent methyltransferase
MSANILSSSADGFSLLPSLICPVCHSELTQGGDNGSEDRLTCRNPACQTQFPIVDGIPVLINEDNSLFSIADFVKHDDTFYKSPDSKIAALGQKMLGLLPGINRNLGTRERYARMAQILLEETPQPVVLVVGGNIIGQGMGEFLANPAIRFVETDITFGPRTQLICDSHDLPFRDGTFDGVVAQAVLEHVVDPHRCVEEFHRVLKKIGIVYAETPFMQQVHNAPYDFTRFTFLGHRRLFRHFTEIETGASGGPGMALAWSWTYFALSGATSRLGRAAAHVVTRLSSFWLKYLDDYLVKKPASLDAASGYYLMGRRSNEVLEDRELIKLYQGYKGL